MEWHIILLRIIIIYVICNKNRNPIDKLVAQGAKELKNYKDLCDFSNIINVCNQYTNSIGNN